MARASFRTRLRAFQAMRGDPPDAGFLADLEYLQNRDLDLSVRLGAMLAFNALLITIGTHPLTASPGAPLSVDAAKDTMLVAAGCVATLPFVISSYLSLRALFLGEEFDPEGLSGEEDLRQRLLAAYILSADWQALLARHAALWTVTGGALTIALWAWIVVSKLG